MSTVISAFVFSGNEQPSGEHSEGDDPGVPGLHGAAEQGQPAAAAPRQHILVGPTDRP